MIERGWTRIILHNAFELWKAARPTDFRFKIDGEEVLVASVIPDEEALCISALGPEGPKDYYLTTLSEVSRFIEELYAYCAENNIPLPMHHLSPARPLEPPASSPLSDSKAVKAAKPKPIIPRPPPLEE